jgi:hypothetical protein
MSLENPSYVKFDDVLARYNGNLDMVKTGLRQGGFEVYGVPANLISELQPYIDAGLNKRQEYIKTLPRQTSTGTGASTGTGEGDNLQSIYNQLSELDQNLISPEQQQRLNTQYGETLGAETQAVASQFNDPYSGAQAGQRANIGYGAAGQAARIPIDLQMKINEQNRNARLSQLGQMAGVADRIEQRNQNYVDTSQYDSLIKSAQNALNFQKLNEQSKAAGQDLATSWRKTNYGY